MDTNKEGYVFQKRNSIYYTSMVTYIYIFKNHLSIMNVIVFNFQNMMNMHKGYEYQNFNYIALKKNLQNIVYLPRRKPTLTNPKQNNLWGN
jgi:hypothetical protein